MEEWYSFRGKELRFLFGTPVRPLRLEGYEVRQGEDEFVTARKDGVVYNVGMIEEGGGETILVPVDRFLSKYRETPRSVDLIAEYNRLMSLCDHHPVELERSVGKAWKTRLASITAELDLWRGAYIHQSASKNKPDNKIEL